MNTVAEARFWFWTKNTDSLFFGLCIPQQNIAKHTETHLTYIYMYVQNKLKMQSGLSIGLTPSIL